MCLCSCIVVAALVPMILVLETCPRGDRCTPIALAGSLAACLAGVIGAQSSAPRTSWGDRLPFCDERVLFPGINAVVPAIGEAQVANSFPDRLPVLLAKHLALRMGHRRSSGGIFEQLKERLSLTRGWIFLRGLLEIAPELRDDAAPGEPDVALEHGGSATRRPALPGVYRSA